MYPEIYNPSRAGRGRGWKHRLKEEAFICAYCAAQVYTQPVISGVQNRNHCPYCLCSRHMDHLQAGDRMSVCKSIMQPIGLSAKHSRNKYGRATWGELMLVHRCSECGKLSINRLAADDQVERLMEIYLASIHLDHLVKQELHLQGIRILQQDDWQLVSIQLRGNTFK